MTKDRIRVGIMGLGNTGRQLYHLAAESDDIEVAAVVDIGKPEILRYLLECDTLNGMQHTIEGNYLVNSKFRSRIMQNASPNEIPWDVFDLDIVIDATGRFQTMRDMQAHLDNGAPRVLLTTLPVEQIDRLIIPGINESQIEIGDRMLSGGSATTTVMALMLKILDEALGVDYATMTTVHAYTSDQPVQDYAGRDYRRSRSAAENIIPNTNESPHWVEQVLPQFQGRLSGYALNVPVQRGSMLDLGVVVKNSQHGVEEVNDAFVAAAQKFPQLVEVTRDPIVSSDVIGNRHSLLFDLLATMKAGSTIVKALAWYETLGHACRLMDVVRLYHALDRKGGNQ